MDDNRFENTYKDLYDCYHTVMNMTTESFEKLSRYEKYYLENMVELCKEFLKETEWVLED